MVGLVGVAKLGDADITAIHHLSAKGIIGRYARQVAEDQWLGNRQKLRESGSSCKSSCWACTNKGMG